MSEFVNIDAWHSLQRTGGVMDLSGCVKLRLSGPDALRYLNGQVSNDLRRLAISDSLPACLCTHKGKLEALVMISRSSADAFLITADAALRDFLPLRVEKYLIADDAVLEDQTEACSLVHLFGAAAQQREDMTSLSGHPWHPATRMGEPGVDVWIPAGEPSGLTFTNPDLIEILRVERGIPAWEPELADGILPPEARLEESAIDYHKGCYTGQEVISRLRSVGRVNRRLERLEAVGEGTLDAGWKLFTSATDGTLVEAGNITSAAHHPESGKWIALGYVKRGTEHANLTAASGATAAQVAVKIRKTLDAVEA